MPTRSEGDRKCAAGAAATHGHVVRGRQGASGARCSELAGTGPGRLATAEKAERRHGWQAALDGDGDATDHDEVEYDEVEYDQEVAEIDRRWLAKLDRLAKLRIQDRDDTDGLPLSEGMTPRGYHRSTDASREGRQAPMPLSDAGTAPTTMIR